MATDPHDEGAAASASAIVAPDATMLDRARTAVGRVARITPVVEADELSELTGARILLKAENLQRTGSFKLRGAVAKLAELGDGAAGGVVAASAGNHAQGVAFAARAAGVSCDIVMPRGSSVAKAEAVRALGATVHLVGDTVEDALRAAREMAAGRALVHPFDDPAVIAGQATLGFELFEQVADVDAILVPVGGDGLASGIALALAERRATEQLIAVQAASSPSLLPAVARAPGGPPSRRPIADGIAVNQLGRLPALVLRDRLHDVAFVDDDAIASATVHLAQRCGLMCEGAGAVGVAALLTGALRPRPGSTVAVILSGGNIDSSVYARASRREETRSGRIAVLVLRLGDSPGTLAHALSCVADAGANIVDLVHVRDGMALHFGEAVVQIVLETRGPEHTAIVCEELEALDVEVRAAVRWPMDQQAPLEDG